MGRGHSFTGTIRNAAYISTAQSVVALCWPKLTRGDAGTSLGSQGSGDGIPEQESNGSMEPLERKMNAIT